MLGCLFDTFTYRCISFRLCNMVECFKDVWGVYSLTCEYFHKVVIDDLSILGDSFYELLHYLE